jgi:hypothetical protein
LRTSCPGLRAAPQILIFTSTARKSPNNWRKSSSDFRWGSSGNLKMSPKWDRIAHLPFSDLRMCKFLILTNRIPKSSLMCHSWVVIRTYKGMGRDWTTQPWRRSRWKTRATRWFRREIMMSKWPPLQMLMISISMKMTVTDNISSRHTIRGCRWGQTTWWMLYQAGMSTMLLMRSLTT